MRVLGANLVGHGNDLRKFGFIDAGIGSCLFQRNKDLFGRDVADQIVSREGTAAKLETERSWS